MDGDINVYNSVFNSYRQKRQNATIFKEIIEQFKQFINN